MSQKVLGFFFYKKKLKCVRWNYWGFATLAGAYAQISCLLIFRQLSAVKTNLKQDQNLNINFCFNVIGYV